MKNRVATLSSQELGAKFAEFVRDQIGGDLSHGWGVTDSAMVIERLIDLDEPTEAIMPYVREVINPSQFRQKLEAVGKLTETKRAKADKGLKSLMASI